jgi:hypothetical protein
VCAFLSSLKLTANRLIAGLIVITCLAVWVYVIVRGIRVPFTTDEAASYGILHGEKAFVDTANNQWLNTQLMWVSQRVFGQSELALRLPNIAAFGLYATAVTVLLSRVRRFEAKAVGFTLLVVNPFLIEFFALARGYGLSLAFSAAAVACLFSQDRSESVRHELGRIALTGFFGSLAFYANFSALNIVLGLLAVQSSDLLIRRSHRDDVPVQAGVRLAAVAIIGLTAMSLVPGILQLHHLQVLNQLYYGGHTGIITDTIGSLLGASSCGYGCIPSWLTAGEILVVVVVGLAGAWTAGRWMYSSTSCSLNRAALLFVSAILAVIIESWLLDALYPIDRTALNYVVLFGVLVAFFVDDVMRSVSNLPGRLVLGTAVGCFVVLATANFVQSANFRKTTIWPFDASSRQVTEAVLAFERRHGRPQAPWKLIAGFPRNEALNYYRLRFKITWLLPVTREPISTPGGDFYYVGNDELPDLPRDTTLLASFADTSMQLRISSKCH